MKLKHLINTLIGGQLQVVLVIFTSLVAALTVTLNTIVIARVARDYLADAESDTVISLASALYRQLQDELSVVSARLALDTQVIRGLQYARQGGAEALYSIDVDQRVTDHIGAIASRAPYLAVVLDDRGDILVGRVVSAEGALSPPVSAGNWGSLPIVADTLASGKEQAGTEIIPTALLAELGLDSQTRVHLTGASLADQEPVESRSGLALTTAHPVRDGSNLVVGIVLTAHVFNNDSTLVDRLLQQATIHTASIVLGNMRVSTSRTTDAGQPALSTWIPEDVRETVLEEGRPYVHRAKVGDDLLIIRYEPLLDHQGKPEGSLQVGTPESAFRGLIQASNQRVVFIALVPGILAAIVAVPIARAITRPVTELVEAHGRVERGDLTARVQSQGSGEIAVLRRSFNSMVERLHSTQQELLHKERLASMGQLAAGVAHEINNPLGTILLFSEALQRTVPEGDRRRDDLGIIIKEITRCKQIVAGLLNFARQQEVQAQETDLHGLLEQVIQDVERHLGERRIQIIRQFSPMLPTVEADAAQLRQVFLNLLQNAFQAIEGDGTITLTTLPMNRQSVVIEVSDTGCGIPEEHLSKLFSPFFTTKPSGKGTGLGLSIAYGIVKMHHGRITAQSRVGQGTTFAITLPLRQPRLRQAPVGPRTKEHA